MKENRASDTALGASTVRAVHQLLDEKPLILEDPISPLLIGQQGVRDILEHAEMQKTLPARALRSHIVLRSRYAEDGLLAAVESGVTQAINLGAGYDTFPFRQPSWASELRFVEMDHPATQRAKLEAIQRAKIPTPGNVAFFPLDLERRELASALADADLDRSAPTFVACLGVLAYLKPETARQVFKGVAGLAPGSHFVFAFASTPAHPRDGGTSLAARTASLGEPWFTRFETDKLEADLKTIGFHRVSFLDPSDASQKYYKGRSDLPAPRNTRLCTAIV